MSPLSQPTIKASSFWQTKFLRGACHLLFAFGIFALGYAGIVFADSHIYQAVEIQKLESTSPPPGPRILAEGDMLGELQVPRLGLDAIVVQGDSTADLRRAVGHLSESAIPGEWGNVALVGHRDTFFRPLRDIRLGDEIKFKTRERSFEYVVEAIEVVAPTDIRVLETSTGHDLTLVTCFPFHFVGPAPKRFVVRAREVEAAR
jgi:sortase A